MELHRNARNARHAFPELILDRHFVTKSIKIIYIYYNKSYVSVVRLHNCGLHVCKSPFFMPECVILPTSRTKLLITNANPDGSVAKMEEMVTTHQRWFRQVRFGRPSAIAAVRRRARLGGSMTKGGSGEGIDCGSGNTAQLRLRA